MDLQNIAANQRDINSEQYREQQYRPLASIHASVIERRDQQTQPPESVMRKEPPGVLQPALHLLPVETGLGVEWIGQKRTVVDYLEHDKGQRADESCACGE